MATKEKSNTTQGNDDGAANIHFGFEDFPNLGKYKVIEKLGEGGFGVVYKGFDPVLQRHVALKIGRSMYDDAVIENFQTESQIIARINHPNVVQVYDFGIYDHRIPYIVMEFVEGQNICASIANISRYRKEILIAQHFSQLAEALAYVHSKNIYHQDIKPENILVSWETSRPKLVDFGIASIGSNIVEKFKGSFRYSAPERFSEEYQPSVASDIYSLGSVLYETLTGQHANPGREYQEILLNVFKDASFAAGHKINSTFKKMCLKCLAQQAEDRYQDASELHLQLISYIADTSKERKDCPFLYLIEKDRGNILFPINKRKYYIGRFSGNDLVIQNEKVSRIHAAITIEDDEVSIENFSEKNPVTVDGQLLPCKKKKILLQDTSIKISGYEFCYVPRSNVTTTKIATQQSGPDSQELKAESMWISFANAMRLLQISKERLEIMIADGELRVFRRQGNLYLSAQDVDLYINSKMDQPTIVAEEIQEEEEELPIVGIDGAVNEAVGNEVEEELSLAPLDAIPHFLEGLEDDNLLVRQACIRALVDMGEYARPHLLKGLKDSNAQMRQACQQILQEI